MAGGGSGGKEGRVHRGWERLQHTHTHTQQRVWESSGVPKFIIVEFVSRCNLYQTILVGHGRSGSLHEIVRPHKQSPCVSLVRFQQFSVTLFSLLILFLLEIRGVLSYNVGKAMA